MTEDGPDEPGRPADDSRDLPSDEPPVRFELFYDGPDYKLHDIDLQLLVHALSGVDRAILESAKVVGVDSSTPRLRVSEDFKEGSFGVEILVLGSQVEIITVLEVLGFAVGTGIAALAGGSNAIEAIKMIRGRTIDVSTSDDGSIASISVEGQLVTNDPRVAKIVTNKAIRSALRTVISKPLEGAGTSEVRIADSRSGELTTVATITDADVPAFERLHVQSTSVPMPKETSVRFLAVDVANTDNWRVHDEEEGRDRTIELGDDVFLQRVRNGDEPNLFGDPYRVTLTTVTTTTPGRRRTVDRTITHVRQATSGPALSG